LGDEKWQFFTVMYKYDTFDKMDVPQWELTVILDLFTGIEGFILG